METRKFRTFVSSPYFNKQVVIQYFADYLLAVVPFISAVDLLPSNIPDDILPVGKKNKKELSYLKSDLYRLAKDFIGLEEMRQEPNLLTYYTCQAFLERDKSAGLSQLEKLKQQLDYYEKPRHEDMHLQFRVIQLLREYLATDIAKGELLLQASIDSLERYYLTNKVNHSWEIETRKVIVRLQEDFRNPLMPEIEAYLETKDHEDLNPQLAVFFQLYRATKAPEEANYFTDLLDLIALYQNQINQRDLRIIYLAAINITLRKRRTDPAKYNIVALQLYEKGIKSKVLFVDGMLSSSTYYNVIKIGLRSKRFAWTANFIKDHIDQLAPLEQADAFHLSSAELAFAEKNYDLTLENLHQIDANNFRYHLLSRVLLIKAFYETDNMTSCLATLGTFTVYLSRRKDVADVLKKNYQNFCKLLNRILMVGVSERKKKKLAHDLENIHLVTEKEWLQSVFTREA